MSENGLRKLFRINEIKIIMLVTVLVTFSPRKENNLVYYFRERISLYSYDIVERRTNLMISTSQQLLYPGKSQCV
jgi:hypothetical protein